MKNSILFIDHVCYKPYDFNTLRTEPLGGTESTVLNVARLLAQDNHVYVLNGSKPSEEDGVVFITPTCPMRTPTHIVHLRSAELLETFKDAFPQATQYIWHHDLGGEWVKGELENYFKHKPGLIFVSDYHRHQFLDRGIKPYTGSAPGCPIFVAHNAITAVKTGIKKDSNKLIFPSSPHKGLKQTLALFRTLRKTFPDYKLYVANPGYMSDAELSDTNVVQLGSLPQTELHKHIEESALLFSGNHVFPETFGNVFYEALALGTPVMAHPFGASATLLNKEISLVDTRLPDKVVEWVKRGITAEPFDLSKHNAAVKESWRNILER